MFDKLAKELSEEDFLVDHYDENTHGATSANARQAKHQPTRFWKVIPWLVHIMGFMTYTSLICANFYSHRGSPCFSETLLDAPILWEDRTYLNSFRNDVFDPYSLTNPDVEHAWRELIDIHITTITEDEKNNLPGHRQTAVAYGGEPGYAVLIEVFHQVHCLDALRKGYFGVNHTDIYPGFPDANGHADHCFSYLLQTLLCHADVGVMTTTWSEQDNEFLADFNVTRQCRNFDAIREWAQTRKAMFNPPARGG